MQHRLEPSDRRALSPPAWRAALAAASLIAVVAIIYTRATSAYFFDDDFHWLAQTQSSFSVANMLDLSRYDHFYRPVVETYFFIGLALFGCAPFPFHVMSVGVHLLTVAAVYRFARDASDHTTYGYLAALFFAIQPGLTDAITWIGAITDSLPVLWYVLAVWLHLRYLQTSAARWYVAAIAAVIVCHLTHESSATLLPMLLVTDFTFTARGSTRERLLAVARRWRGYVPFAVVLLVYLGVAYVVNTRSYLVQEGHYAFGWHAIPNIANYIIWLYVGQRAMLDYVVSIAAMAAMAIWGTPRMRFAVAWIIISLLPVSFFTWGNAARYLYLPAVGFAMLVAELLLAMRQAASRHLTPRTARAIVVGVAVVLAVRFAIFAKKAADSFPERTAHYERFITELRRSNPNASPGATVFIDQRFLEGVPELYREPAAQVGLCLPALRLQMR